MPDSLNDNDKEDGDEPPAYPREGAPSFTLRVPPYAVSLDAIAGGSNTSALASKAQGNRQRTVASKFVVGALVIAAAGLVGAALAFAVPPGNVLDSATRARVPTPRPLSSTATTSAEVH